LDRRGDAGRHGSDRGFVQAFGYDRGTDQRVLRNGPADKAGSQPGDVLLSVEGKSVHQAQSVLNAVSSLSPGSNAKLALKRQGRTSSSP
jgi:S1-C subfamily serine protease